MQPHFEYKSTRSGPDPLQLVVGGQVTEMRWSSHTFAHATAVRYEVSKAHRPPDAPEPGSLVGEDDLKQQRLRKEIGELEAEYRREKSAYIKAPLLGYSGENHRERMDYAQMDLDTKRRELAALTEQMARRTLPSPTNDGDSR